MKKISYSILCLILFSQVNAILLINENFDYVLGDDLAKYGWSVYSGSGTGEILISSPGLSYSNYANSDIGYSAKIDGPGEDLSHSFDSSISSGSVYYSFMASFSGASYSSDNYIICFRVSGETYRARFFIKKESEESNNVRFGICKSSSIPSVTTSYDYSLNQVYLFVIKYTFQTGDDEVCLFINPNLSGEEPDPIISSTEGTDATYLAEACIRQESGVYGLIDGIRVAQSWGDSPLPVTLSSFTGICENGYPQLEWVTQSELENMGWYIFRSEAENGIEANDFLLLNETLIPGNGTTTQPSSYEFTDDFAITTGETYWYWLQSVSYSNELEMYGPVSV
ncbi:MAG TPA: hypothetical protein PLD62_11480, partial [Candidatus Cloacimonadota bacterium]|nr:hypothetical protein [Candidatus Cloacimonadota bacterium]